MSSNIPRFASDLSFNPLEPQKPSSSTLKSKSKEPEILKPQTVQPPQLQQQQPQPDIVPAVEFDWSGAGLTNPLDGEYLNNDILCQ